jgi:hypothetical protein
MSTLASGREKDFQDLLNAALSYEWLDPETNMTFCSFLTHLNSANSAFLVRSLTKLVRSFYPVKLVSVDDADGTPSFLPSFLLCRY